MNNRASVLEEQAQIPPLYSLASIDPMLGNFSIPRDNKVATNELGGVVGKVRTYQRTYPDPNKPGLMLMGDPGTGKTHLAVAVLRYLLQKGHEGIFFDYQTLLDRIYSGYSKDSGLTDKKAYREALDTEVLLLDDLGANRVNDWVEDIVTSIITHRCNNKKTTIVTTNLSDVIRTGQGETKGDFRVLLSDRIGPRARSRLFEMCHLIRMPLVEDYRLRKAVST